jgi:hypothetical protein
LNHFFGGMYVEKVLCGPNSARSLFSKKMRSIFFDTQEHKRASDPDLHEIPAEAGPFPVDKISSSHYNVGENAQERNFLP